MIPSQMLTKAIKSAAAGLVVGFGVGLVMTFSLSEIGGPAVRAWNWLNAPAVSVAKWLIEYGYQPAGEVGVVALALLLTLVQWSLIGLSLGLIHAFAVRHPDGPGKNSGSARPERMGKP